MIIVLKTILIQLIIFFYEIVYVINVYVFGWGLSNGMILEVARGNGFCDYAFRNFAFIVSLIGCL